MKTILLFVLVVNLMLFGLFDAESQSLLNNCETENLDCVELEQPDNNLQTIWEVTTGVGLPCFNPVNHNEFVFVKKLPDSPASTLCIHDLVSGVSDCLPLEHGLQHQPRWHSSGWILFRGNWSSVYRIMSSGGEVDTLSIPSSIIYRRPIWKPDGSGWTANTSLFADGEVRVYDLSGNISELIPGVEFNMGDWDDNNRIVTRYNDGASEIKFAWAAADAANWEIIAFNTPPFNYTVLDIKWLPFSNDVVFSQNQSGIYKINVLTHEIKLIKDGCYDRYYGVFSISQDGSKLVAERFLKTHYYTDGFHNFKVVKKEIVVMNCDGTEETVIDLEGSLAVIERASVREFQVFPNPASHNVEVRSSKFLNGADVTMYNVIGRQVFRTAITGYSAQIDVSTLAHGMYFIRIRYGTEEETHKLIVE